MHLQKGMQGSRITATTQKLKQGGQRMRGVVVAPSSSLSMKEGSWHYPAQASARVKSGAGSVFAGSKTRCFTKLNKYMSIFNPDSVYVQNCLSGSYSSHKNANRTNISIPEFQRKGANGYLFESGFSFGLVLG